MPPRKKDIIEALKFAQENENLEFSDKDPKGLDLSMMYKLRSDEYLKVDGKAVSGTTIYTNLRITISGIMLLDDLEKEAYRNSFKGIIYPKIDKLLWLVAGWLLAVLAQLIK